MNINILPDLFTRQAEYFKALAHPVRLQILTILRQGEACVCHLEAILHKRQAYISQQLAVLRQAGLLTERKEGLFVYYGLADANLTMILDTSLVSTYGPIPEPELPDRLSLTPLAGCACPVCAGELSA
jgi:DNA-binding transcriptional ArsR family regulator